LAAGWLPRARSRRVAKPGDRPLRYRKLLIASGAQPRQLHVGGADLEGIFTLRSLDNARAIRDAAAAVRNAVVVGGGFIGIEVAASLTQLGIDVTLVSRSVDLFAQLGSPEISEHLCSSTADTESMSYAATRSAPSTDTRA
jgi:NADPH-dependent 2,4-dienoyl-CoA reductase/sulfur reductase-like enzyme